MASGEQLDPRFHTRAQPMGPAEAIAGERRAQVQDHRVREVFERLANGCALTPSQVHGYLCDEAGPQAPLLTSIRRSLTNLTRRGALEHHRADRRPGPHGATESTWSLRRAHQLEAST